jgi:hypothetical protein
MPAKAKWGKGVARWNASTPAIEAACAILKLRHGVHIAPSRMTMTRGRYGGLHKGYHDILLAANMRSDAASRVIWHELVHACQRERFPNHRAYDRDYSRQLLRAGLDDTWFWRNGQPPVAYRYIPAESEAMAFERLHNILPLAEPGQPREAWARTGRDILIVCR